MLTSALSRARQSKTVCSTYKVYSVIVFETWIRRTTSVGPLAATTTETGIDITEELQV